MVVLEMGGGIGGSYRPATAETIKHDISSVQFRFSSAELLPSPLSFPLPLKPRVRSSTVIHESEKKVIIAAHLSRQHHGVSIYTALIHNPCPEGRKFSQVIHFCLTRVLIGQGD